MRSSLGDINATQELINEFSFTGVTKSLRAIYSSAELMFKGSRIRKVDQLVEKFGGRRRDWKKMKGWDENGQEWHWYENAGRKYGMKKAGEPDPF